MSLFIKDLICQGSALVYFDDFLLKSKSEPQIQQLIKHFHDIANTEHPKLAPEKSCFMLLTLQYLGHEIGLHTIKLKQSKIAAIQRVPPTIEIGLVRFIGSMNFYFKFIGKLHVNMNPLYDLLHDSKKFN